MGSFPSQEQLNVQIACLDRCSQHEEGRNARAVRKDSMPLNPDPPCVFRAAQAPTQEGRPQCNGCSEFCCQSCSPSTSECEEAGCESDSGGCFQPSDTVFPGPTTCTACTTSACSAVVSVYLSTDCSGDPRVLTFESLSDDSTCREAYHDGEAAGFFMGFELDDQQISFKLFMEESACLARERWGSAYDFDLNTNGVNPQQWGNPDTPFDESGCNSANDNGVRATIRMCDSISGSEGASGCTSCSELGFAADEDHVQCVPNQCSAVAVAHATPPVLTAETGGVVTVSCDADYRGGGGWTCHANGTLVGSICTPACDDSSPCCGHGELVNQTCLCLAGWQGETCMAVVPYSHRLPGYRSALAQLCNLGHSGAAGHNHSATIGLRGPRVDLQAFVESLESMTGTSDIFSVFDLTYYNSEATIVRVHLGVNSTAPTAPGAYYATLQSAISSCGKRCTLAGLPVVALNVRGCWFELLCSMSVLPSCLPLSRVARTVPVHTIVLCLKQCLLFLKN